ncbi:hypothetical protein NSPZN2_30383 [Nitrospira defluvii]|uniref:Uncharacterized protein n=1 Tax=Nitrospira defluvii TaxID=330214 RepID=A0ABM8RJ13_9BACT|nr:hypothetical protein NSPZN2_30383 [Nitrospira defluvii]
MARPPACQVGIKPGDEFGGDVRHEITSVEGHMRTSRNVAALG